MILLNSLRVSQAITYCYIKGSSELNCLQQKDNGTKNDDTKQRKIMKKMNWNRGNELDKDTLGFQIKS